MSHRVLGAQLQPHVRSFEEAQAATEHSKLRGTYWHGTPEPTAVRSILTEGFNPPSQRHGAIFGKGVYLTPRYHKGALSYAGPLGAEGVVPAKVMSENPLITRHTMLESIGHQLMGKTRFTRELKKQSEVDREAARQHRERMDAGLTYGDFPDVDSEAKVVWRGMHREGLDALVVRPEKSDYTLPQVVVPNPSQVHPFAFTDRRGIGRRTQLTGVRRG